VIMLCHSVRPPNWDTPLRARDKRRRRGPGQHLEHNHLPARVAKAQPALTPRHHLLIVLRWRGGTTWRSSQLSPGRPHRAKAQSCAAHAASWSESSGGRWWGNRRGRGRGPRHGRGARRSTFAILTACFLPLSSLGKRWRKRNCRTSGGPARAPAGRTDTTAAATRRQIMPGRRRPSITAGQRQVRRFGTPHA
jgi:hypothetical protein